MTSELAKFQENCEVKLNGLFTIYGHCGFSSEPVAVIDFFGHVQLNLLPSCITIPYSG